MWDIATGPSLPPPLKHEKDVTHAEFSPDGRRVLTASLDGTARVWDVATGFASTPLLRHDDEVKHAAFSPDGRRIVTVGQDNTARLWDAATGQPSASPLKHEGEVNHAAFSPDGRRVLTASSDNTARVWDAATGQPLGPPLEHGGSVVTASFSPDGRRVLTVGSDHTARVWDVATGEPLAPPLKHEEDVRHAEFSPDGRRVLTASDDNTARLWNAATGQPSSPPLEHNGDVNHAAFSPDGLKIVTASQDHTALVWDAATGQPITPPLKHGFSVEYAEFSPDGLKIATSSWDNTPGVWDAATGQPLRSPMKHAQGAKHVAFSPNGRQILTTSSFGARVWDFPSGDRESGDLMLLAHLLSGSRVEKGGENLYLTNQEFRDAWRALREKHPEDFVASDREVLAWHRREADDCEAKEVWISAIWHLDRLIAVGPARAELIARRGQAYLQSGRSEVALADCSKAIDLEPAEAAHWIGRGDAYAELARWKPAAADFSKAVELERGPGVRVARLKLAKVALAMKDVAAYRRLCADLIGEVSKAENDYYHKADPYDVITVAWILVLVPDAGVDRERIVKLAKTSDKGPKPYYYNSSSHFPRILGAAIIAPAVTTKPSGIWTKGSRTRQRGQRPGLALPGHGPSAPGPHRRGSSMDGQGHVVDRFLHQGQTERRDVRRPD